MAFNFFFLIYTRIYLKRLKENREDLGLINHEITSLQINRQVYVSVTDECILISIHC